MATATPSLKIRWGAETRRVGLDFFAPTETTLDWNTFANKARELFNQETTVESVQYTDTDGDLITLSSTLELKEALQTSGPLTLTIPTTPAASTSVTPGAPDTTTPTRTDGECGGLTRRGWSWRGGWGRRGGCGRGDGNRCSRGQGGNASNSAEKSKEKEECERQFKEFVANVKALQKQKKECKKKQQKHGKCDCNGECEQTWAHKMFEVECGDALLRSVRENPENVAKAFPFIQSVLTFLAKLPFPVSDTVQKGISTFVEGSSDKLNSDEDRKTALQLAQQSAQVAVTVFPENASLRFTAARVEALQGNHKQAISHLKAAFLAGFKDFEQVETDNALASLKDQPEFITLITNAKNNTLSPSSPSSRASTPTTNPLNFEARKGKDARTTSPVYPFATPLDIDEESDGSATFPSGISEEDLYAPSAPVEAAPQPLYPEVVKA
eukprot:TRINITY_DN66204_c0_g1_i1.p1 TRINITY_DN66204_c0_g1~~TRINITY_DN66204_c0_g1_i1.p1  ORF type:complete len:474 (-),score=96.58 TRINITY_DN66204_c0_g1_i1:259-1581(-)